MVQSVAVARFRSLVQSGWLARSEAMVQSLRLARSLGMVQFDYAAASPFFLREGGGWIFRMSCSNSSTSQADEISWIL